VVSGGDPKAGTQFEQLVQKLMEEDGDPQSAVWRNPLMVYSKDPIAAPLTTFTSETLQTEALKLFKVIFDKFSLPELAYQLFDPRLTVQFFEQN